MKDICTSDKQRKVCLRPVAVLQGWPLHRQTHPRALVTLLVSGPLTDYRTITESCPYSGNAEGQRVVRYDDVCTANTPSRIEVVLSRMPPGISHINKAYQLNGFVQLSFCFRQLQIRIKTQYKMYIFNTQTLQSTIIRRYLFTNVLSKSYSNQPGITAHAFNPSTWEAEADGS